MDNIILKYQKAFNTVFEGLKSNKNVDCIIVLGSMVSGDIWDESDIDLIVIMSNQKKDIEDVYSTIDDIHIQIKFISREFFFEGDNTKIMKKLRESKVMLCRDNNILTFIRKNRYGDSKNNDLDSLIYLGRLLKDIDIVKKYIHNNSLYIAYSVAVRCAENLCSFYLSVNKYTVSNESIKLAVNLNDDIKNNIDKLFFKNDCDESCINEFVKFAEKNVLDNLDIGTIYLMGILSENKKMSSTDICNIDVFNKCNINIEDILDLMYKKGLIHKAQKMHSDDDGEALINENVYYI